MSDCPPGCRVNFNIFYIWVVYDTTTIYCKFEPMFVKDMDHLSSHHVYSKQILLTPPTMETAQYLITARYRLAKSKSGVCIFFPARLKGTTPRLAPARTRTQVVRLGAQCTDHWTTEQSRGPQYSCHRRCAYSDCFALW